MNDVYAIKLAYLAGFFDGEGCVYIIRHKRKTKNFVAYGLEISFTGSQQEPLELARSLFRGSISVSKDPRPDRKPVYRLRLRSVQAADALFAMLPYLIVKKERAELGIDFQRKLSAAKSPGTRRSLPVDECEGYKVRITSLNDKVWNGSA